MRRTWQAEAPAHIYTTTCLPDPIHSYSVYFSFPSVSSFVLCHHSREGEESKQRYPPPWLSGQTVTSALSKRRQSHSQGWVPHSTVPRSATMRAVMSPAQVTFGPATSCLLKAGVPSGMLGHSNLPFYLTSARRHRQETEVWGGSN